MSKKIWLSSPNMGGDELKYIHEAFDTNWIAPLGPNVNNFEKEMAAYTGINYAAALSSGTAAIHLALIILGVKAGDEVLCQSFTFSASANPIAYQQAVPVFIDSESETWNMDPALLETAIKDRISKGKRPKAVIVVHLYGQPAKMDEITSICRKYEIPLIEDAAEALGSSYKNKMAGSFGEFGVLSFNGNKIITTSGGGMLLSDDEEQITKARFFATQARDDAPHYQHSHIGYNYRMSNVLAGIGLGQLKILEQRVAQKREIFNFYAEELSRFPGIQFQPEMKKSKSNKWLTAVTIDAKSTGFTREDLRLTFDKENIEARPLWKPMHLQPVFKSAPAYVNGISEKLFQDGLCLPSDTNMTQDEFSRIQKVLNSLF